MLQRSMYEVATLKHYIVLSLAPCLAGAIATALSTSRGTSRRCSRSLFSSWAAAAATQGASHLDARNRCSVADAMQFAALEQPYSNRSSVTNSAAVISLVHVNRSRMELMTPMRLCSISHGWPTVPIA